MKTIKIIWPNYHRDALNFKSFTGSWINHTAASDADIKIYVDQMQIPDGEIALMVEPRSIHPGQYEYVKSKASKLKTILSYDSDYFGSFDNFIKIPPPFGAWVDKQERGMHTKTKNISFIASTKNFCKEHAYRQEIVQFFQNNVDLYGRGRQQEITRKVQALKDYRFSVCMENYIANLYYTEKLLDCFLCGTIPIFWGSREIINVFDVNGIVFLDDILSNKINIKDLNEEYYNLRLDSISKNFKIASSMNNSVSHCIDYFINKTENVL